MRRGEIFWGGLLVVLGILFLLKTAGFLLGDVFGWFWPLFIVAMGAWILLDRAGFPSRTHVEDTFSIPLQGAKEATLRIDQGAGRIEIGSGAGPAEFMTGTLGTGMTRAVDLTGDKLEVRIEAGPSFLPFVGPQGGAWHYRLNPAVPTALSIHSGASRLDLDLTDLQVIRYSFEGGASQLNLTLPARVANAVVDIEAGAAGIDLRVPEGVALRLHMKSVGSLDVNETRFPRVEPGLFQSPDYDTAKFRADATVEGGATSIRIR
jgi:hypothetical protein